MLHISARFLRHFLLFTMVLHFSLKKITPFFGSQQQKNADKRVLKFCVLVQNALYLAAKRSAISCKTQGKMLQNAR